jgi:hypothetical protein
MARNSPTLGTSSSYVASTLSEDFQVFCCKLHAQHPSWQPRCKNQQVNKVKGQLGFPKKTKSPSGATTGGIPPPQKWSHFFAKVRKRAKYDSTLASSEFRRGAGGQAEKMREPEIAYASARIWPFSLTSDPAGYS